MANLDLRRVIFIHTALIGEYGGSEGVRDVESLEAAIARPWGAYFGKEHFPTPFDKAAAITESIIRRHSFLDGNKRTGISSGAYLLSTFGYEVESSQKELEDFGVDVANDEMAFEEISGWFEGRSEEAGR
ncbi:MAG: type II toxin-antitoxin system death-on-curing family toxin [Actinomycetota bacterium]|nr:type II toxin-antitoxin system death-on-curing family toxin [Rubrobacter sp.]MDQ3508286.1 type II toxin-antitoxin system death-on-curing family toxin [Actinomycetota bacterium]